MILEAGRLMNVHLARSWIVGDRLGDIAAGRSAGLRGGILISAGRNEERQTIAGDDARFTKGVAANLAAAVAMLLEQKLL